jgi:D-xylose transport system substrate-binding protein
MKSLVRLITLALITVALFSACVKGPEGDGTKRVKGTGPVRIGFSMDTLKEERWQRDKALVEQRC